MAEKPIMERILEDCGFEALAAIQRALGPYNDVDHWPHLVHVGPERAARLAYHCRDAEEGAVHAMTTLRDWLNAQIEEVTNPIVPQDERVSYGSPWCGDADDVVIALAKLAEARNRARPAR